MHHQPERAIKVNKARLSEQLRANREKHVREYQEAVAGYRERLITVLARKLEAAKKREHVDHRIDLAVPISRVPEYDQALAMLEWEEEETLTLSPDEFRCFVLDAWPWRDEFKQIHADYIGVSGPR